LEPREQGERVGVVEPGEERALGTPHSSLPGTWRGTVRRLERDFLQGHVVVGKGVMALNGKKVDSYQM